MIYIKQMVYLFMYQRGFLPASYDGSIHVSNKHAHYLIHRKKEIKTLRMELKASLVDIRSNVDARVFPVSRGNEVL